MEPKPLHTVCVIVVLACVSFGVRGQEAYQMMDNADTERDGQYNPVDRDGGAYLPGREGQVSESQADSASYSTSTATESSGSASNSKSSDRRGDSKQEGDDSVLSFNFLYYIIQKFKMSDIVDQ